MFFFGCIRCSADFPSCLCRTHLLWKEANSLGSTPRGSCNNTLVRRVLRRLSGCRRFFEGFVTESNKVVKRKKAVAKGS